MKKVYSLLFTFIIAAGCIPSKKSLEVSQKIDLGVKDSLFKNEPGELHAAATRSIDVMHTSLDVNFNWEKQRLNGKATILLKPYFYPVKEIILDAKNFEIKEVSLLSSSLLKDKKEGIPLLFTYDKKLLTISLDKEYTRKDTLKVFIDYIAKPNEREAKTGSAIASDKGLYFINPTGKEKNKPVQIWTQGEPESNSCWFPTVDKPNESMTHEIYITIDSAHKNFVTLSNGLLISSQKNTNGSRTDHWKQSLPAAPYLVMMAIGDFSIVKDKWKNLEVNYYVEPEYQQYAKSIFGNTPEMIDFFSNKLGVPYPWEKYSQVVVRDYVSGAMENVTAVIHGEFLNQTDRELLDINYEDVISHELFHHWFGNYVTCESWSNITLNEGFATYGEYLWKEYKYGRDAADHIAYESMKGYLSSAAKSAKHLIRYTYKEPDDVFDAHSYNKGGAIIHMLRKYVGDEAFFSAVKIYLNKHKFSSVEADDLRLVFEQVTGQDLHWFFDQWFFSKGHPKLTIQHNYNDTLKKYTVRIQQIQDVKVLPVFKLPVNIEIYNNGKIERKQVWVNEVNEEFSFNVDQKPDLVNVDADKSLLCTKEEKKSVSEWVFQYNNCPLYIDRLEALNQCAAFSSIPEAGETIISALNDKMPEIRERAVEVSEKLSSQYKTTIKEKLIDLAKNDVKSTVRALAIEQLSANFSNDSLVPVYNHSVRDKSHLVAGSSLSALAKADKNAALSIAKEFETEKNMEILFVIARIYSAYGNDKNNSFFVTLSEKTRGWENASFASTYTDFLKRCNDDTINSGVLILEKIARTEEIKWVRHFGQKGIQDLAQMYANRIKKIEEQLVKLKAKNNDLSEMKLLEQQLSYAQNQEKKLTDLYKSVKEPS